MNWYEEYGFGQSIAHYPTTIKQVGTWIPEILVSGIEHWIEEFVFWETT